MTNPLSNRKPEALDLNGANQFLVCDDDDDGDDDNDDVTTTTTMMIVH